MGLITSRIVQLNKLLAIFYITNQPYSVTFLQDDYELTMGSEQYETRSPSPDPRGFSTNNRCLVTRNRSYVHSTGD